MPCLGVLHATAQWLGARKACTCTFLAAFAKLKVKVEERCEDFACRGVTEELLRQRVQGLRTTLATFQGADEDAWSSSDGEEAQHMSDGAPDAKTSGGQRSSGANTARQQGGVGSSKRKNGKVRQAMNA
jgi:hypothetical protein